MISLRVPSDALDVIDRAAAKAGVTRTEWMVSRSVVEGKDAQAIMKARARIAELEGLLEAVRSLADGG